jgi:predicted CoA-binding protein
MKYMQRKGYRVIPVNPVAAGQVILGEIAVPDLASIAVPIDIVDIFRKPAAVPEIVEEAIRIGAKVVWMQLSVRQQEAAARAEAAGLKVVQDRCVKIEFGRLSGELSWNGINSDIITSRRRKLIA